MLQNILINLNILSKIKPYDKIYINKDNLITIEYNSIFQGIYRFFYNNNREKNLTNLVIFYQTVYSTIDDLLNSQYLNIDNVPQYITNDSDEYNKTLNNLTKIKHYLELSIDGINNLKKTYHGDIVTDSRLDIIINNCEMYIDKICKKITIINLLDSKYNLIKSEPSSDIPIEKKELSKSSSKDKLL